MSIWAATADSTAASAPSHAAVGETDAQVADAPAGGGRDRGAVGAQRVERDRRVLGRARHHRDVVHRPRQRHDAARGDGAVGRLEADDAAQRGGDADRGARVGAERREAHARWRPRSPTPPLEPPGIRVGSCGLRACGLVTPSANSCVEVLPRITAPAARQRSTPSASLGGHVRRRRRSRSGCGRRATLMTSLTETGMPCSGPRRRPARSSASRARASASAASAKTSTNAVHSSLRDPRQRLLGQLDAGGLAGVERAGGGGDRAGLRQPAERGQRRGGRPEDLVGGPPLGRVDDLRLSRSSADVEAVVAMLMAAPPRTCARAARPRGAPRPRRCARCARASARRRHRRGRRGRSPGSPGAPRSSPRSGPAS